MQISCSAAPCYCGAVMYNKIRNFWLSIKIRDKITVYISFVFIIIILSLAFDVMIAKKYLLDFSKILEDNSTTIHLVDCLEAESEDFRLYARTKNATNLSNLKESMKKTKECIEELPFDYHQIGEERYALTWSIKSAYEVYDDNISKLMERTEYDSDYIRTQYKLYEEFAYIEGYADKLVLLTIDSGDSKYRGNLPKLFIFSAVIMVLNIILFLAIITLSKMMISTMVNPIIKLADASRKIAMNDFSSEDVMVPNQDEVGELVSVFNSMKYSTKERIQALEGRRKAQELLHAEAMKNIEMERQLEQTQTDLLRNQINPHFLFNTLNVISGMANLEDAPTTEKMIGALSALFRYNLKNMEHKVALKQELKIASDYMYLQKMRFGSRIEYREDIRVNEDEVMIPSYLLQPLLENSIIHGLAKKEKGGKVKVCVWMKDNFLHVIVADNGTGIQREYLQKIQNELENGEYCGIGVGNIYKRIHSSMWNGTMRIKSKENGGTIVRIVLPVNGGCNV